MNLARLALLGAALGVGACDRAPAPAAATAQTAAADANMVLIPAGEFIMGSNKVDQEAKWKEYGYIQPWFVDEHPQRKVNLAAYYIDRFEVTQAAFADFLVGTGQIPRAELEKLMADQAPDWGRYPIVTVTWYQARDFCAWAGKRLPTEAEWEKAARGVDGREFPWGNDWDPARLNAGRAELATGIAPVGMFEAGRSAYGLYDMAGNVSEWTDDWYQAYPGAEFASSMYGQTHKVVRGGGWGGVGHYALTHFYRAAYRDWEQPDRTFNDIGFRCARDAAARAD